MGCRRVGHSILPASRLQPGSRRREGSTAQHILEDFSATAGEFGRTGVCRRATQLIAVWLPNWCADWSVTGIQKLREVSVLGNRKWFGSPQKHSRVRRQFSDVPSLGDLLGDSGLSWELWALPPPPTFCHITERWSPRFVQSDRRNVNSLTVWASTNVATARLKRCYLSFCQSVPRCLRYPQSPALQLPS
jgi:hypothetical protein